MGLRWAYGGLTVGLCASSASGGAAGPNGPVTIPFWSLRDLHSICPGSLPKEVRLKGCSCQSPGRSTKNESVVLPLLREATYILCLSSSLSSLSTGALRLKLRALGRRLLFEASSPKGLGAYNMVLALPRPRTCPS